MLRAMKRASGDRERILTRIGELRRRIDPDVLDSAERMARNKMGLPPKPSMALTLWQRARAQGGRYRSEVLAELERRLGKRRPTH
jgi:hypothetical protein